MSHFNSAMPSRLERKEQKPPPHRSRSFLFAADRWIVLGLMLSSLAIAFTLIANRSEPLVDDSYYYLRIAQFVAAGRGSTFDGINPTNGYHPLWLFLLVPIFWLTSAQDAARLLSTCFQALFFTAGVGIFYLTARLRVRRLPAIAATSFWALLTYHQSLGGTEFSVHALSILAVAYFYMRQFTQAQSRDVRAYLTMGVLSSLAFLARLDTILLAAAIGVSLIHLEFRDRSTHEGTVRLLGFSVPVLAVCLAYAGANLVLFGHALPISGVVKASWSAYYLSRDSLFQVKGWMAAKLFLVILPIRALFEVKHPLYLLFPLSLAVGVFGSGGLLLASILLPMPSKWRKSFTLPMQSLWPFVLYSLMSYMAYMVLYQGSFAYYPWYYVIQPWLSALILALLLSLFVDAFTKFQGGVETSSWPRRATYLAMIALNLAIPLYMLRQIWPSASSGPALSRDPLYEAAIWIRHNLPADANVGSWSAGMIGFYSGRRVVNLDGLVNSWDFFETRQHDLCRYWREEGINYLADGFQGDRAMSPIPSYQNYAPCAGRLEMLWARAVPESEFQIKIYRINWADQ